MSEWKIIVKPAEHQVTFAVEEAAVVLYNAALLSSADDLSGLGNWVYETWRQLNSDQRFYLHLAMDTTLFGSPREAYRLPFMEYLASIKADDPIALRDRAIAWMEKKTSFKNFEGYEVLLADEEAYVEFIRAETQRAGNADFDEAQTRRFYHYYTRPEQLKAAIIMALEEFWTRFGQAEWEQQKPTLKASVEAYNQVDFRDMDPLTIIELVTGRDVRNHEHFGQIADQTRLTFIPAPHIGPYIGGLNQGEDEIMIFYGAMEPRIQAGVRTLNNNDILMRLTALADETRLRILELLTQREEICAQDFMTELNLSQSSASRHLRQLTATGFLTERRRDVAKCYALNGERFDELVNVLRRFAQKRG